MPTASWNRAVIAQATNDEVKIVENNVYFPATTVNQTYLQASSHETKCPWKGTASYYNIIVDGKVNENAAWYYAAPFDAAKEIAGHIAFWRGVDVQR